MLQQFGGGAAINLSSIARVAGSIGYRPAKHGVVGATKDAALGNAKDNIGLGVVCPGYIKTAMAAQGRASEEEPHPHPRHPPGADGVWGRPQEICAAVAFVASDDASFITRQPIVVDGGMTAR